MPNSKVEPFEPIITSIDKVEDQPRRRRNSESGSRQRSFDQGNDLLGGFGSFDNIDVGNEKQDEPLKVQRIEVEDQRLSKHNFTTKPPEPSLTDSVNFISRNPLRMTSDAFPLTDAASSTNTLHLSQEDILRARQSSPSGNHLNVLSSGLNLNAQTKDDSTDHDSQQSPDKPTIFRNVIQAAAQEAAFKQIQKNQKHK